MGRTSISQVLSPAPPDLFRVDLEPDPQENFQFIKHGVKITGMPAFGPSKTDEQVWALVAFLNVLAGISAAEFTSAIESPSASLPVQPAQNGG